jgi:lantibiotic leader peptide-processing serine protease
MHSRTAAVSIAGILALVACTEERPGPVAPSADLAAGGGAKMWVVAFKQQSGLPSNVDQLVASAGGTIVVRIPEIAGIAVNSANPDFGAAMGAKTSVQAADLATPTQLIDPRESDVGTFSSDNNGGNYSPAGADPQVEPDPLGVQQWDKMRMNVSTTGSYALQRGRHEVRVSVLDTGADQFHIDVLPNLDIASSASFVPSEPTIQDFNGHGTWTISAVGAPINGVGISGVAPNVTLVELKVLTGAGSGFFIWLDQALVYAGVKHFDIASMSLGGYIPKCGSAKNPNGCDHPDYILLNRAVQFARSQGVLPVAAMGNDNFDVSDGSFFRDYIEAPGEIAGVVGVSATGYYNQKAHYSSYGMGKTDVSAPGGATRNYTGVPGSGAPPFPPYLGIGRLIGAWSSTGSSAPSDPVEVCTGPAGTPPCFLYGYVQGTSMATPNAAGVAALIISQYGDFSSSNKPHMSPNSVEQYLQQSANNQPCPDPRTVLAGPGFLFPTATCQGNTGYNNFFGKGIVDAVKAVTLKNNGGA